MKIYKFANIQDFSGGVFGSYDIGDTYMNPAGELEPTLTFIDEPFGTDSIQFKLDTNNIFEYYLDSRGISFQSPLLGLGVFQLVIFYTDIENQGPFVGTYTNLQSEFVTFRRKKLLLSDTETDIYNPVSPNYVQFSPYYLKYTGIPCKLELLKGNSSSVFDTQGLYREEKSTIERDSVDRIQLKKQDSQTTQVFTDRYILSKNTAYGGSYKSSDVVEGTVTISGANKNIPLNIPDKSLIKSIIARVEEPFNTTFNMEYQDNSTTKVVGTTIALSKNTLVRYQSEEFISDSSPIISIITTGPNLTQGKIKVAVQYESPAEFPSLEEIVVLDLTGTTATNNLLYTIPADKEIVSLKAEITQAITGLTSNGQYAVFFENTADLDQKWTIIYFTNDFTTGVKYDKIRHYTPTSTERNLYIRLLSNSFGSITGGELTVTIKYLDI